MGRAQGRNRAGAWLGEQLGNAGQARKGAAEPTTESGVEGTDTNECVEKAPMRTMMLAGAAVLALAVPAVAQDAGAAAETEAAATAQAAEPMAQADFTMSATQQTSYDGWPADRKASYDGWPGGVQEYYWTLTPTQQTGWWALTDAQRVQVFQMTPAQRTSAWAQISAQVSGATPPAAAASTGAAASASTDMGAASATTSGNMRFVASEMVQSAPPPKADYPICEDGVTDGCINPRAAGKNYGNVPLDYWPGRPASEIDEPLPAKKPAASTEPAETDEPES